MWNPDKSLGTTWPQVSTGKQGYTGFDQRPSRESPPLVPTSLLHMYVDIFIQHTVQYTKHMYKSLIHDLSLMMQMTCRPSGQDAVCNFGFLRVHPLHCRQTVD